MSSLDEVIYEFEAPILGALVVVVVGVLMFCLCCRSSSKSGAGKGLSSRSPEKWYSNWDGKEASLEPSLWKTHRPARTIRWVILVRSGQFRQVDNCALTLKGRCQVQATAKRLREMMEVKYDRIIRPKSAYAVQTAALIQESFPEAKIVGCSLIECKFGLYPCRADFLKTSRMIEAAFKQYFYRASPDRLEEYGDIIVCEPVIIIYFICRALQISMDEGLRRFEVSHGSISALAIDPDGQVRLTGFNEMGHISVKNITPYERKLRPVPVETNIKIK